MLAGREPTFVAKFSKSIQEFVWHRKKHSENYHVGDRGFRFDCRSVVGIFPA